MTRSVEVVRKELAWTIGKVAQLRHELKLARKSESGLIVAAFDEGFSRRQLVRKFNRSYQAIGSLLQRFGRSDRQRTLSWLSEEQKGQIARIRQAEPRLSLKAAARLVATEVTLIDSENEGDV